MRYAENTEKVTDSWTVESLKQSMLSADEWKLVIELHELRDFSWQRIAAVLFRTSGRQISCSQIQSLYELRVASPNATRHPVETFVWTAKYVRSLMRLREDMGYSWEDIISALSQVERVELTSRMIKAKYLEEVKRQALEELFFARNGWRPCTAPT